MNSSPASAVGMLDRLCIGVSRVSIRRAGMSAKARKVHRNWTGFKPGHGEDIYVFNHIENGMVVYSHEPTLKRESAKALSQIPFTVKKQRPPIIRQDYWQPLCMIRFGPGQGLVGRNVYQKLKEFRQLHELQWGWQAKEFQRLNRHERGEKILNQKPNAVADIAAVLGGAGRGNKMWEPVEENAAVKAAEEAEEAAEAAESKTATVEADQAQQETATDATAASTAPDSAQAEQAGEMKASASEAAPSQETTQATVPSEGATRGSGEDTAMPKGPGSVTKSVPAGPPGRLRRATVYWANDVDLYWARQWSDNVEHQVGLPKGVKVWNWKTQRLTQESDTPDETKEVAEGASGETDADSEEGPNAAGKGGVGAMAKEGEGKGEKESAAEDKSPKPTEKQEKKGWFGWSLGKSGDSSQDVRV